MKFFPVIIFHDRSMRVILPKQLEAIKGAFNADAKYIDLDGDVIMLSSISRIESSRHVLSRMPHNTYAAEIPESDCRELGLIPLTDIGAEQEIKTLNRVVERSGDAIPEEFLLKLEKQRKFLEKVVEESVPLLT